MNKSNGKWKRSRSRSRREERFRKPVAEQQFLPWITVAGLFVLIYTGSGLEVLHKYNLQCRFYINTQIQGSVKVISRKLIKLNYYYGLVEDNHHQRASLTLPAADDWKSIDIQLLYSNKFKEGGILLVFLCHESFLKEIIRSWTIQTKFECLCVGAF